MIVFVNDLAIARHIAALGDRCREEESVILESSCLILDSEEGLCRVGQSDVVILTEWDSKFERILTEIDCGCHLRMTYPNGRQFVGRVWASIIVVFSVRPKFSSLFARRVAILESVLPNQE